MDSLFELLQEIRPRPELFIGKPSLERLRAFIDGYRHHSSYDCNQKDCLTGFQEYVEAKYNIDTDHHWSDLIQFFNLNSERDAFNEFYILLDKFMSEKTGDS